MQKLAKITRIKKKFRRVRHVIFTVNYLYKIVKDKKKLSADADTPTLSKGTKDLDTPPKQEPAVAA